MLLAALSRLARRRPRLLCPVVQVALLAAAVPPAAFAAELPARVTYNEHIRPLLSDRCFYCHGPDEKHREANLRLDTLGGATADLGGYQALVPGQAAASVLLERVRSSDPTLRMPPVESKRPPFSAAEIALLERWIDQGAEYEDHWAFLPLRRELPPAVAADAEIHNPIDQFIVARLAAAGLRPSPEAEPATLIRRATLDLTGLLPTPAEVDHFLADRDPAAYERLIDRLLASPHYGERWGRHWLDQARYADSHGYTVDGERPMWPYRDWVIQALNRDLPFDQFTREQLAGDLLDNPTKEQLIATAFHRNTLINQEGGTDDEQFRTEATIDRVNTTGAVWLGLTLGCAQCHSHKFDPISQREYYQLLAFFNSAADVNNAGPTVTVAPGELFAAHTPTPAPPMLSEAERAALRGAWEERTRQRIADALAAASESDWEVAQYVSYETTGGGSFELLADQSLLYRGDGTPRDTYAIEIASSLSSLAAVRLRVLTHESLPKQGPGNASNGNFVLSHFQLLVDGRPQALKTAFADHEQPRYGVLGALDTDSATGWAINVGPGSAAVMNAPHEAVFVLAEPLAIRAEQPPKIEVRLAHEANDNYLIGRVALDVCAAPPVSPADRALHAALATAAASRTAEQAAQLEAAFQRDEPRARTPSSEPPPGSAAVMIMRDLEQPRETYLLVRGDFTRPDKEAGALRPNVPATFGPPLAADDAIPNRRHLANWLVDPRNPLPARVTMNRTWLHFFGRGIVETDEDFGAQGAPPTHPRLLDWLAAEFMRQDWSMKAMHRLIVTSATYRQASVPRADLTEKDPRNLLLGRQERFRLEAEVVRDAGLTASGLMAPKIGGPSVHPPQPEGVYAFTQTTKQWPTAEGADRYRRGLYTFFFRSAPYPLFTTFDTPDFQTTCTRRLRSNTPLQSLTLSNDPAFLEMARALALRVVRELPGDASTLLERRIELAMRYCLSRRPTAEEAEILRTYYEQQLRVFQSDPAAAEQFLGGAASTPETPAAGTPAAGTPAESAAWVAVARALLNTDNFITRD